MNMLRKILPTTMSQKPIYSLYVAKNQKKQTDSTHEKVIGDDRNSSNYLLVKTIGTGTFGRVFLARDLKNPRRPPVAIKRFTKVMLLRQKQVDHVTSERQVLSNVDHPFLVKMHRTFKDDYYLYIVLEFVNGGEFFTYLRKCHRLRNSAAVFYAAQITLVFEYLHSKNIIYRDLKPENILISTDGYLKLTDFGFAKVVDLRTYTLCGTPEYIAPEILMYKGHGKPVDWWTLGILIYEMLVGYPPFVDDEPIGIYKKILDGKILFPRYFDKNAKSLVKRLLTHDLGKRYGNLVHGVNDIKHHPWFESLSWKAVLHKLISPPYKPKIRALDDTSHFEEYNESNDSCVPVTGVEDPFYDW